MPISGNYPKVRTGKVGKGISIWTCTRKDEENSKDSIISEEDRTCFAICSNSRSNLCSSSILKTDLTVPRFKTTHLRVNNNIQTSWTMSVGHQAIYKSIPLKNIAQKEPIWLVFLCFFPSMKPLPVSPTSTWAFERSICKCSTRWTPPVRMGFSAFASFFWYP